MSVSRAIGNTPLVELTRLVKGTRSRLWAKLEWFNPTSSVKDRIACAMLDHALAVGTLEPGGTVVESSSGNTGIGLASLAASRGLRAVIICTERVPTEKLALLQALRAHVVRVPSEAELGSDDHFLQVGARLAAQTPGAVFLNQYGHPANGLAHYRTTGPEVWNQTNGQVDVLVAGAGTGGTISGTGRYLKECKPSVRIVLADPEGSIYAHYVATGELSDPKPYQVEAVGQGQRMIPANFDRSVIDEALTIPDAETFRTLDQVMTEEGLMCGSSSGLALAAALRLAREHPDRPQNIVAILADSAERYLVAMGQRRGAAHG